MTSVSELHIPAGSGADNDDPVVITPARAGWQFCGLRILRLHAGQSRRIDLDAAEAVVVPLSCPQVSVRVGSESFALHGRRDVFARIPDYLYVPSGARLELVSDHGGLIALPTAATPEQRPARLLPADDVKVEIRGAGRSTRQVTNFLTPEVDAPHRLMCCEVLTPPGNWSSHPPHKHDDASGGVEAELEEIYYFQIEGEHGFGMHRTYDSRQGWNVAAAVHAGDAFLIPRGYHGPCAASPEHAMWYLNVLAGPGRTRSMAISDDPDHAWVRDSWRDQERDPRVPMTSATGPR